jgi:hypothetical protein
MKQYKLYILILLFGIFFIPSVALAVWWNPLTWFNNWGKGDVKVEQKYLPIKNDIDVTVSPTNSSIILTTTPSISETTSASDSAVATTVYGVKIHNTCLSKFDDFIKKYGADYSKCLVDFNFNADYCAGLNPDTEALSNINLIVILDASGSMEGKIGSETKMNIAKKAVAGLLTEMPQGVNTGLVVYGQEGSGSAADKSLSCNGIKEVVKLGSNNGSNIISAMNSFSPRGWTPIAGSLNYVKDIFKNNGIGNKDYLVLVSDGVESCDGDAISAAQDLNAEIPDVKLNVVGFTSDSTTQNFLKKIASVGGGLYLTATNSSDIDKAFNKELTEIKKDCLSSTLSQMYVMNNANNTKNLNCWLSAYKKEADAFSAYQIKIPVNKECNSEIASVLGVRRNEFWFKKEALSEKNDDAYKKIQADFNNQLKVLDSQKN